MNERCPNCNADISKLAIMEYPIGEPYLWHIYCTKCGFGAAAKDSITGAIKEWMRYAAEFGDEDRKARIKKNIKELRKRGVI